MPNAKKYAERVNEATLPGGGLHQTWRVFYQELVNGDAVVDSLISGHNLGFTQADFHNFGLWVRADSVTATPELAVDILQSWDDHQENYGGSGEGPWISDNLIHVAKLNIPPMRFMRIRLAGKQGNPPDTFVDAYLFMQRG